jgi:SsrA-binding protein
MAKAPAKAAPAAKPAAKERPIKVIARNPRARHDYEILHTYEAGLVLQGTEVKSLRKGRASLIGAFGRVHRGEVWIEGLQIPPYEQGNIHNHQLLRARKLLLHRQEINRLIGAVEQKGHTLVPLEIHFKGPTVKVVIALGRGKKEHDKRDDLKKREHDREIARALRSR